MNTTKLYNHYYSRQLKSGNMTLGQAEMGFAAEMVGFNDKPDRCSECILGFFKDCCLGYTVDLYENAPTPCQPYEFAAFLLEVM